jgi:AraC-like DNA-binding protein
LDHVHISTAHVLSREQFAFWREGFNATVLGTQLEPLTAPDQGFRAEVEAWMAPSLTLFRLDRDNATSTRGPREIGRRYLDVYWIMHEHGDGVRFEHTGHDFVTSNGDLFIGSADLSFAAQALHRHHHDIWLLPTALVAPHLPARGGPLSVLRKGGTGTAALLAAYLDSLGRALPVLSPFQLDAVADNLARLVAITCGASDGEHRHAVKAALAERANAYIARHLADPNLGPASTAAALGVAERTLHHAFAPTGTSFAEEVMRRRLAECRAALASPLASDRSVADIAFAWGFQSLATFYRAFRRAYGVAPGNVREAALGDGV